MFQILKHLANSNSGLHLREDSEESNQTFAEVQENGKSHRDLNYINCARVESEKAGSVDVQENGDFSGINFEKFESQNAEQLSHHVESFQKTSTDKSGIDQSTIKTRNSQTSFADVINNSDDIYYATKLGNGQHTIQDKVCDSERKAECHISSGSINGTSTENVFLNYPDNQEILVTSSDSVHKKQNKHGNGWDSLFEFVAKNENSKIKPFDQSLYISNKTQHLTPVKKLNNLRREQINYRSKGNSPVNYYEKSGNFDESSQYFLKSTRENLPDVSNMISLSKPVSSFQVKDGHTAADFIRPRMEANPSTQTSFASATQSLLDNRSNMFQNVKFQSKATFDYNHGLPFEIDYDREQNCDSRRQMEKNVNQFREFERSEQSRNTYLVCFDAQNETYLHKPNPEIMFPPAEEIDRLVSLNLNNMEPSDKIGIYSREPGINQTFDIQFQPEINNNLNNMKKSVLFDLKPVIDVSPTKIKESRNCGTETVELPLFNAHTNNNKAYVNPNIGRITQKLELTQALPVPHIQRSLEDDLRETTRNYLANSQQFSR